MKPTTKQPLGADSHCISWGSMRLAGLAAAGALSAAAYAAYRLARRRKRTILITGGCGNLGIKLATHLLARGDAVVLLEHPKFVVASRVPAGATLVQGDLADPNGAWRSALRGVDAVVHFSAVNPYPNATWEECAGSMAHTFNIALAATGARVRRFVLASSNHVMGGYKDRPELGMVRPSSAPRCAKRPQHPATRELRAPAPRARDATA